MLIRMISMMGCLFYSMRGFIQFFTWVPTIFHPSSIHVTPMIGGIDYSYEDMVFLNDC